MWSNAPVVGGRENSHNVSLLTTPASSLTNISPQQPAARWYYRGGPSFSSMAPTPPSSLPNNNTATTNNNSTNTNKNNQTIISERVAFPTPSQVAVCDSAGLPFFNQLHAFVPQQANVLHQQADVSYATPSAVHTAVHTGNSQNLHYPFSSSLPPSSMAEYQRLFQMSGLPSPTTTLSFFQATTPSSVMPLTMSGNPSAFGFAPSTITLTENLVDNTAEYRHPHSFSHAKSPHANSEWLLPLTGQSLGVPYHQQQSQFHFSSQSNLTPSSATDFSGIRGGATFSTVAPTTISHTNDYIAPHLTHTSNGLALPNPAAALLSHHQLSHIPSVTSLSGPSTNHQHPTSHQFVLQHHSITAINDQQLRRGSNETTNRLSTGSWLRANGGSFSTESEKPGTTMFVLGLRGTEERGKAAERVIPKARGKNSVRGLNKPHDSSGPVRVREGPGGRDNGVGGCGVGGGAAQRDNKVNPMPKHGQNVHEAFLAPVSGMVYIPYTPSTAEEKKGRGGEGEGEEEPSLERTTEPKVDGGKDDGLNNSAAATCTTTDGTATTQQQQQHRQQNTATLRISNLPFERTSDLKQLRLDIQTLVSKVVSCMVIHPMPRPRALHSPTKLQGYKEGTGEENKVRGVEDEGEMKNNDITRTHEEKLGSKSFLRGDATSKCSDGVVCVIEGQESTAGEDEGCSFADGIQSLDTKKSRKERCDDSKSDIDNTEKTQNDTRYEADVAVEWGVVVLDATAPEAFPKCREFTLQIQPKRGRSGRTSLEGANRFSSQEIKKNPTTEMSLDKKADEKKEEEESDATTTLGRQERLHDQSVDIDARCPPTSEELTRPPFDFGSIIKALQSETQCLADRKGFLLATTSDAISAVKDHCARLKDKPQAERHWCTDGLPCNPLSYRLLLEQIENRSGTNDKENTHQKSSNKHENNKDGIVAVATSEALLCCAMKTMNGSWGSDVPAKEADKGIPKENVELGGVVGGAAAADEQTDRKRANVTPISLTAVPTDGISADVGTLAMPPLCGTLSTTASSAFRDPNNTRNNTDINGTYAFFATAQQQQQQQTPQNNEHHLITYQRNTHQRQHFNLNSNPRGDYGVTAVSTGTQPRSNAAGGGRDVQLAVSLGSEGQGLQQLSQPISAAHHYHYHYMQQQQQQLHNYTLALPQRGGRGREGHSSVHSHHAQHETLQNPQDDACYDRNDYVPNHSNNTAIAPSSSGVPAAYPPPPSYWPPLPNSSRSAPAPFFSFPSSEGYHRHDHIQGSHPFPFAGYSLVGSDNDNNSMIYRQHPSPAGGGEVHGRLLAGGAVNNMPTTNATNIQRNTTTVAMNGIFFA